MRLAFDFPVARVCIDAGCSLLLDSIKTKHSFCQAFSARATAGKPDKIFHSSCRGFFGSPLSILEGGETYHPLAASHSLSTVKERSLEKNLFFLENTPSGSGVTALAVDCLGVPSVLVRLSNH
jgi:hypothetical protein